MFKMTANNKLVAKVVVMRVILPMTAIVVAAVVEKKLDQKNG